MLEVFFPTWFGTCVFSLYVTCLWLGTGVLLGTCLELVHWCKGWDTIWDTIWGGPALALGHGFMDGLVSIAAVDPFVVRDVGISIAALLLMPISLFILRESYWNIKWFVVVACATSALTYYQLGYLLSAAPATTPHGIYIEQLLCALLFGACAAPACMLWWRRCTSSRDGGGNGGGDGDGGGGGGGPNGFTVRRFRPTPATQPGPEPEPDDISLAQSQQPAAGGAGPSAELRRMNGVSSSRRP